MILHYYRDGHGNFGDDINEWLWQRLVPDWWDRADETHFSGIGTLIDSTMPPAKRWIVFSSGAGYGPPPPSFGDGTWTISCVRGPLSAKVLDLPANSAITDGAILVSSLSEYRPLPAAERSGVIFMPHRNALNEGVWDLACARAGVEFVSPRDDSRSTIERIRRARLVLADAMHSAIVADCLRVPWLPVMTSDEINTFKWLDWCLSLKLPYEPVALPSSSLNEKVQSRFLLFYGNKYALREHTVDAAIRHFRRHRAMKSQRYWWMVRNIGRGSFTRVVRPALQSRPLRAWRRRTDERSLERAAETLERLRSHPGFLSDDRVLASKQDELLSRLMQIDKAVRPKRGLTPA